MDRLVANLNQRVPVNKLKLEKITTQKEVNQLNSVLSLISNSNPYYVKSFLSINLPILEAQNDTTGLELDSLYDLLSEVMMSRPLPVESKDLITYNLNSNTEIKIWESPNLISGQGTTGLRTWEASLYLCEYILQNELEFVNKDIIELGCGTGIIGILLLKLSSQGHSSVCLTDGDENVVKQVYNNLEANGLVDLEEQRFELKRLFWGQDKIEKKFDLLVGADITYDGSVIPFLIEPLIQALGNGCEKCIISATERNTETLKIFEKSLSENNLKFEVVSTKPSNLLGDDDGESTQKSLMFYRPSPQIKIYEIKRA